MKSISTFLLILTPPLQAFHQTDPKTPPQRRKTSHLNLHASVEQAISEAQTICAQNGPDSQECKVAWDIVEELEAADSHRYDAAVAAASQWEEKQVNYLPLLEGMDVLSAKLDRKLYELNSLSRQLAEAGAGEEIERLVSASEEMRGLLESARGKIEELKQY